MEVHTVQTVFESLISRSLREATLSELKILALAIWHEDFTPTVGDWDESTARRACYLVDCFLRFNIVTRERQQPLLRFIAVLQKRHKIELIQTPRPGRSIEQAAWRWGLDSGCRLLIRELLPYQTRHYRHPPAK